MAEKKLERRGLGRGLSALMADIVPAAESPGEKGALSSGDQLVAIESIRPNPRQPRRSFSAEQLAELTDSIREKGIIQPLIVRPDPDAEGKFEIVAGERRWRAAQAARLHEIPVLVRDYDDIEVLEVAIIENIQRADLNPIEEATGYRQLMDRFGHTQERIASALGRSRSHIANVLRLLTLPEDVQKYLREGQLSAGHARALVTSENAVELARQVINRGLSVRDTEKLVRKQDGQAGKASGRTTEKDADTKTLEADLSAALGMKLRIDHKKNREAGKVTIEYASLDELDRLCGALSAARV